MRNFFENLRLTRPPESDPLLEVADLPDALRKLDELETDLEPEAKPNRRQRRAAGRSLRRMVRRPEAVTSTFHPLLRSLTPRGRKAVSRRRAKNRVARLSRRRNR